MNKDSEKTKEQTKRKSETNNQEHDRNSVKKSTLSLSEIPNIIKEELNTELNPKKSISQIFLEEKGLLYPNKLKKSFIFDRIKTPKDETPSSLAEVKKLLEIENKEKNEKNEKNEKKNKSITKKEKEKEKKTKQLTSKNLINVDKRKHFSQKKFRSTKHKFNTNNLYFINNKDKIKEEKNEKDFFFKSRKSDFTRKVKKDDILSMDSPKKKAKRKSIISQPDVSPSKIYTTEIFQKFFSKKNLFEEKEIRNEDKIYINIQNKEELLITVNTAQETIKNYYEYMQDCFQIIDLNFNKSVKLTEIEPVKFQFKNNKKIVVFELESTLVSYYIEDLNLDNGTNNTIGINIRPHLKQSLDLIKNDYNIVIYSSGNKNYVDAILDFLDPEHIYFNFRLYREHCNKFIINNKIYFTKNLNIFKNICSLKDIVIVDCSVIGFGFFLENGIPIVPYYDSKEDVELELLSYYLLSISSNNDLRIALKRDIGLDYYLLKAREINSNLIGNSIKRERESINISPELSKQKRKIESKTFKFTNYIHIQKRNSHSFEEKQDNKKELNGKGSKKKRRGEKEEDNKYISPKKERESLFKKKKRKFTANTNIQQRNFLSSREEKEKDKEKEKEKGKKMESKKHFDKNK